MDVRGAQELAKVLQARGEGSESTELIAADAAPIFHWLGVQPPVVDRSAVVEESAAPTTWQPRRRMRRR